MKHLKQFEEFEFSNSLPVAPYNILLNYYSCDECDKLWKVFNEESSRCIYCGSKEIENLSEDEWYEIAKSRLDEDEIKNLEKEKEENKKMFIDIFKLKNKKSYAN